MLYCDFFCWIWFFCVTSIAFFIYVKPIILLPCKRVSILFLWADMLYCSFTCIGTLTGCYCSFCVPPYWSLWWLLMLIPVMLKITIHMWCSPRTLPMNLCMRIQMIQSTSLVSTVLYIVEIILCFKKLDSLVVLCVYHLCFMLNIETLLFALDLWDLEKIYWYYLNTVSCPKGLIVS